MIGQLGKMHFWQKMDTKSGFRLLKVYPGDFYYMVLESMIILH